MFVQDNGLGLEDMKQMKNTRKLVGKFVLEVISLMAVWVGAINIALEVPKL